MKYPIINRSKKSHKKKEKAVATPEVEWVPIEEMESAPTNIQSGTGRIYCTGNPFIQSFYFLGTVVYGKGTHFLTELAHGDVLVIQHPQTYVFYTMKSVVCGRVFIIMQMEGNPESLKCLLTDLPI